MAFERERRINFIFIVAGSILAVGGFAVYFVASPAGGVIMMIAGAAVLVISLSISNAFSRMRMMEMLKERRKMKK